MKIIIEKNPKESIWEFPCLGQVSSGTKVYFYEWERGVVVESNNEYKIGYISAIWNMDKFTQIDINGNKLNTNPESIDWDKVKLPIWLLYHGNLLTISDITGKHMRGFVLKNNGRMVKWDYICDNIKNRNDYLNSLEILPKGTKITFEL